MTEQDEKLIFQPDDPQNPWRIQMKKMIAEHINKILNDSLELTKLIQSSENNRESKND